MNLEEMKKLLIDNNNYTYEDIICPFIFNDTKYEAQVQYAYFNSKLDIILKKYELEYNEELMLKNIMDAKNYKKYMDKIVRKLYYEGYSLSLVADIIIDILELFNEMISLFDSGNRISHDISLTAISLAMDHDSEIEKIFSKKHANADMTPEEIADIRDELANKIKKMEIPGISDLIRAGTGVKIDQMINVFFGLFMRVKASENIDEIYPRFVPERWVDGVRCLDSLFIETSIQRLAAILNSQTMKKSGVHNKDASILAQDTEIIELDCGSTNYQEYFIEDEVDLKSIEFKYRLEEDGSLKECTTEDKHLIGTTVKLRSAMKCACESGVCATCFGSNAKWNLSNPDFRFDVGFVSARYMNSEESQKVLSVKHSSTPILVRVKFNITNMNTGEVIYEDAEKCPKVFSRKWNKIIFNEGAKVYFEVMDVKRYVSKKAQKKGIVPKNDIGYFDTEFGENDIIRVKKIYFDYGGESYIFTVNEDVEESAFRISGFPKPKVEGWDNSDTIYLDDTNELSYVILNNKHVTNFRRLQEIYKISTKDIINNEKLNGATDEEIKENKNYNIKNQIEYMYNKIKHVVKGKPVAVVECALRQKVRSIDESRLIPDFRIPNVPYRISSAVIAMREKPTISAILPRGHIYSRITDKKFHDVNNLDFSVFDLLFHNDK